MTTAKWDRFEIDGEEIEVVTSFTFLGSEVEKEGRCDKEIKRRVVIGKATMIGLEKLWRDKHVSINTKKRIVRTLIFTTVLYSCETWTMTKKMKNKINACEMWIWRKMQRISWTEKKTNESVRGDWNRRRRNASTNSAKKEARILWTCYAIRWIGKRNDAGTRRWKQWRNPHWSIPVNEQVALPSE